MDRGKLHLCLWESRQKVFTVKMETQSWGLSKGSVHDHQIDKLEGISTVNLMPPAPHNRLIQLLVAEAQLDTCPAEPLIAEIPLILFSVSTWLQLVPSVPFSPALTLFFQLCSPHSYFLLSPAQVLSPDGLLWVLFLTTSTFLTFPVLTKREHGNCHCQKTPGWWVPSDLRRHNHI